MRYGPHPKFRRVVGWAACALAFGVAPLAAAQNTLVAKVLSRFDIDRDGKADLDVNGDGTNDTTDSDGDGLPDRWELGGIDVPDTSVPFPRPVAIVPGTPPTPIFSRDQVRTSAATSDTDGDGLSDFVEVFGLKFIDDNGNGVLDADEWADLNGDGMPSIGEFPIAGGNLDFDGFVFTDPTNADTDGDGLNDREDPEPLVNPRAFGLNQEFFGTTVSADAVRNGAAAEFDADNDGLGDGMDLGNDGIRRIDNPTDLIRVIKLFRDDLLRQPGTTALLADDQVRVPEGLIEDLLGADWNGDGLFRVTDVRDAHFGLVGDPTLKSTEVTASALFSIDLNEDGTLEDLGFALTAFPTATFQSTEYLDGSRRGAAGVRAPLPYQEVLLSGAATNVFLPDVRIWTVLYSWRMPGFDIDGNGYVGLDDRSNVGNFDVNGADRASSTVASDLLIAAQADLFDGQIDAPFTINCGSGACGAVSFSTLLLTLAGIPLTRRIAGRRNM